MESIDMLHKKVNILTEIVSIPTNNNKNKNKNKNSTKQIKSEPILIIK